MSSTLPSGQPPGGEQVAVCHVWEEIWTVCGQSSCGQVSRDLSGFLYILSLSINYHLTHTIRSPPVTAGTPPGSWQWPWPRPWTGRCRGCWTERWTRRPPRWRGRTAHLPSEWLPPLTRSLYPTPLPSQSTVYSQMVECTCITLYYIILTTTYYILH